MSLEQTNDASFNHDVLESSIPVLVDFWAEWCGPCRMIAPILEELEAEFKGKIKIVKLNIDENPNIPGQLGVRSIPTLAMFKEGKPISTKVGLLPKGKITEWIQSVL